MYAIGGFNLGMSRLSLRCMVNERAEIMGDWGGVRK